MAYNRGTTDNNEVRLGSSGRFEEDRDDRWIASSSLLEISSLLTY